MKFSYNWLQSYFKEKLPAPDKLAELLILHSFETQVAGSLPVGQAGRISHNPDFILDIDVLPNRISDCASHLGIAREIAALTNFKLQIPNYQQIPDSNLQTRDYIALEVERPDLCPRYIALLVKGVKVGQSPEWIQERLLSVGQKPINNIVDVVNYAMLETGQPLHAFDLAKIGKKKIVVRMSKAKEKIATLDNRLAEFGSNDLVIADGEGDALAIAGIKGGKKAEIAKDTKDIIIEAAIFNPIGIRNTSRRINIKTDASLRFEHGLSLFLPEIIIDRMARLIQETAGGEVAASMIDFCPFKPEETQVILNKEDVFKVLGIKIDLKTITAILERLGFAIKKMGEGVFVVYPPKERTDINIKEDLAEEIGRIYGYENISSKLPEEIKIRPEINEEYAYSNWVRGILSSLGFFEVYNYSFWKAGDIAVENPKSPDKAYLRIGLSDRLKLNMADNLNNNFVDIIKFFEIGKVFSPEEDTHLVIAAGDKKNKIDVAAELKGAAKALFIDDADSYIKENIFEINLKRVIEAAKEHGVDPEEVAGFESKDFEYKPFSRYPAIVRDISLFVPVETRIEEVAGLIENAGGELLIDTDLFDEYTPPDGDKKSLAFRLVFQSFDKTLTDEEVNKIRDKIINALEQNIQWEARK